MNNPLCRYCGKPMKIYDEDYYGTTYKCACDGYKKDIALQKGNKILVEASPYDTIWGIGMDANNLDRFDTSKWKGTNLLGKALMEVREKLKKESESI